MLPSGSIKAAMKHIRSTRWQSLLTMLGIIVGVASVVTTVSIGQGIKTQIAKQVDQYGKNVISVRSGNLAENDPQSSLGNNIAALLGSTSLSDVDYNTVKSAEGVDKTAPFNIVSGSPSVNGQKLPGSLVVGTSQDALVVINHEVDFGNFFSNDDDSPYNVVIGKEVASQLFQEMAPLGRTMKIKNKEFIVRGVLKEFSGSSVFTGIDYNKIIYIPYSASQELLHKQAQIYQILALPKENVTPEKLQQSISENLTKSRGNNEDFSVLKQADSFKMQTGTLNLLTTFIASVAAISLLVGGIGIMNIMLVIVTERTREIGVRKAVGATDRQIMMQFMTESSVISVIGGLLGVMLSLVANYFIRLFTDLQPVLSWPIMAISVAVALAIGIIFGTMPAVRAAKKDPILALRHE